jgi:hypothetical protein
VTRPRFLVIIAAAVACIISLAWYLQTGRQAASAAPSTTLTSATIPDAAVTPSSDSGPTTVYAHNLMLRKGPDFRIYVRWLRGQMVRTHPKVNPSFDDPESFFLNVNSGVIRANIGDIGNFLNANGIANSPLKNVTLSGDGDQIKIRGTVHKIVPLPIELSGTISAAPNDKILMRVTKLSMLKIPVKGILGGLHVNLSQLFDPKGIPGIEVSGNDILFDTHTLLPPPRIRGQLTSVRVVNPDLEEVFGNAQDAEAKVEQWRNFLKLSEGTLDFGKLTMRHVDFIMIDLSNDAWFDLDLVHYQDQLVNGYTRMTPQAGLQIFMPDLDDLKKNKAAKNINMEWMKNRNIPPPPEVTAK